MWKKRSPLGKYSDIVALWITRTHLLNSIYQRKGHLLHNQGNFVRNVNPHEECTRQFQTQQTRDNHFGSGDNLQNIVNIGVRGMKMEERREVLLPDQKQYKEDDGKKLGEEGEKRSLALEKKLHTKMKTEEKEKITH